MADAPGAETLPGALVEGYEALRAAVVGGQAEGWRHGYGVLAAGGMGGLDGRVGLPVPGAGRRDASTFY